MKGIFYGWRIVAALFLIVFILWGGYNSFGVFFIPLSREFGSTGTITSGIMTLSLIMGGFFGWMMGGLADRYGPRIVLAGCSVMAGCGYILMSRIDSLWQVYIWMGVMVGIAMSSAYAVPAATVGRWFIKRRGLALAVTLTALGTAQMVAPPLAAQLIEFRDWRFAYLVIGLSVLTVGTSAAMFLRRAPEDIGLLPDGETANPGYGGRAPALTGYTLAETLRTPALWVFCAIWGLMAMPILLVVVHVVPYAINTKIGPVAAASVLTVMGASNISGRFIFGSMADRMGSRPALLIALVTQTTALFIFASARDLSMFYLAALLFGGSASGGDVIVLNILAQFFGRKSLGTIVGVTGITWRAGAATGPILGGWVSDVTGSYSLAFLAAATGTAICIGLAFILFAKKPRPYTSSPPASGQ